MTGRIAGDLPDGTYVNSEWGCISDLVKESTTLCFTLEADATLPLPNTAQSSTSEVQPVKGSEGTAPQQTVPGTPTLSSLSNAGLRKERRSLRDAYKAECKQHGIKVTDTMIAEAASANWHSRTAIQKWLALDERYDGEADRLIRSVFARKPHIPSKP